MHVNEDKPQYCMISGKSDRNNGGVHFIRPNTPMYTLAVSTTPLLPSDDEVSPSCCDRVTYQVKNSVRKRNAALTCNRSSRRISVALFTCTIMAVSRPPSRVLLDSMSRLLYRPGGSESESLMDPFTGVSVEDGDGPLSPARTMISVGANA